MAYMNQNKNVNDLRVIKTARDMDSINMAAKNGFKPLMKRVQPSEKIRSKYCVVQNKKSGEIEVLGDYRALFNSYSTEEFETVIDWTFYYPNKFNNPYAAYLIPQDMTIGERVYIEDLIEDYIGGTWNQGDTYRLDSCEAIWTGTDLDILHDASSNRTYFIG